MLSQLIFMNGKEEEFLQEPSRFWVLLIIKLHKLVMCHAILLKHKLIWFCVGNPSPEIVYFLLQKDLNLLSG